MIIRAICIIWSLYHELNTLSGHIQSQTTPRVTGRRFRLNTLTPSSFLGIEGLWALTDRSSPLSERGLIQNKDLRNVCFSRPYLEYFSILQNNKQIKLLFLSLIPTEARLVPPCPGWRAGEFPRLSGDICPILGHYK